MDSTGQLARCIQRASCELGLPAPADVDVKQIIGLGVHDSSRMFFPGLGEAKRADLAFRRRHLVARDHDATRFWGGKKHA